MCEDTVPALKNFSLGWGDQTLPETQEGAQWWEKGGAQLKCLGGNFCFTLYCWNFFKKMSEWQQLSEDRGRGRHSGLGLSGRACETWWNLSWTLKDTKLQKESHSWRTLGQDYGVDQGGDKVTRLTLEETKGSHGGRGRKRLERLVMTSWCRALISFFLVLYTHTHTHAHEYVLMYSHMNFLFCETWPTISLFPPAFFFTITSFIQAIHFSYWWFFSYPA